MKKVFLAYFIAFITIITWGCAGPAGTGYSVLDTIPSGNAPIPMAQGVRPVVAVGPVGVPGYIIRAATIVASSPNQINISTADQDAAPLGREIPRVITVNMEQLLTPGGFTVVSSGIGTNADYRIAVDLSAFDVTQFNTLETKGRWALYQRGNPAPLLVKDVSFSTPAAGSDTMAVRTAMSRALADLATVIVRDFEGFLGKR